MNVKAKGLGSEKVSLYCVNISISKSTSFEENQGKLWMARSTSATGVWTWHLPSSNFGIYHSATGRSFKNGIISILMSIKFTVIRFIKCFIQIAKMNIGFLYHFIYIIYLFLLSNWNSGISKKTVLQPVTRKLLKNGKSNNFVCYWLIKLVFDSTIIFFYLRYSND